jgi:hypothetical protein
MDFLKQNWWKLLPFVLFFFGVGGILAFTALLIMYMAFHAASSLPVNPKRGKFLTWLIVIETVMLVAFVVMHGVMTHDLGQISSVFIFLEAVCLVGIWKWKRVAAIGLMGVLVVHFTKTFVQTAFDHDYPATMESTISLWLFLAILVAWLGLWVKALKQKWMFFA